MGGWQLAQQTKPVGAGNGRPVQDPGVGIVHARWLGPGSGVVACWVGCRLDSLTHRRERVPAKERALLVNLGLHLRFENLQNLGGVALVDGPLERKNAKRFHRRAQVAQDLGIGLIGSGLRNGSHEDMITGTVVGMGVRVWYHGSDRSETDVAHRKGERLFAHGHDPNR